MAKRYRDADINGIVSAGLKRNLDDIYLDTNIVNLSNYDPSFHHGSEANFSSTRTQQIVGSTSKSEVGIVSADINTKSLPLFQPQVKQGTDPDALVYEVGLSASWSGCLFNASIEQTSAQCDNIIVDQQFVQPIFQSESPTFWNDKNASILFRDSYGLSIQMPIVPDTTIDFVTTSVEHTLLQFVLYWMNVISYHPLRLTCLDAVLTPSVYTPIVGFGPAVTTSTSMGATTRTKIGTYVLINDPTGFNVGDRIRVFGTWQPNSTTAENASNVNRNGYGEIGAIWKYSDLASKSIVNEQNYPPTVATFEVNREWYLSSQNVYAIFITNDSWATGFTKDSPWCRGGYLINQQTDSSGGKINFLTDTFKWRPRTSTTVSSTTDVFVLDMLYDESLPFGYADVPFGGQQQPEVVFQITCDSLPYMSGLYKRASNPEAIQGGVRVSFKPLNHVLTSGVSAGVSAHVQVAPNGYTFVTELTGSYPHTTADTNALSFMRTMGFKPETSSTVTVASYPPTATKPQNSWRRAYSADFTFSSYQGLKWTTQDIAPTPNPPKTIQDFVTNSGTYYNVYDINRFLIDSVNPAFQAILFDDTPNTVESMDDFSLQRQLTVTSERYQYSFATPLNQQIWSGSTTYQKASSVVIKNGRIYLANRTHSSVDPEQDFTHTYWRDIGVAKTYTTRDFNLVFSDSGGVSRFICSGFSSVYERINPTNKPIFVTNPPRFSYTPLTGLISYSADSYSFGDTFNNKTIDTPAGYSMDYFNTNYSSWGYQNGSGNSQGEEHFIIESNSSFKFLADNFPVYAVNYVEPTTNDNLIYWVWSTYSTDNTLSSITGTEGNNSGLDYPKRVFTQSFESLSSSLCPVQSIVVVSKSTPVVPSLISPPQFVSDTNSTLVSSQTISGETQNIIGEFFIDPATLFSTRSIIRYRTESPCFYSMQNAKVFKQFDYSIYYRHRITQQLVPLILTNYGSAHIKFVFRPTSD